MTAKRLAEEGIRPDPFTVERFGQVVRQANTKTDTQEGDFFQRLLREALAHIAHLQGMVGKSCELSGGDLIEIGNLRAEVSRLAAENERLRAAYELVEPYARCGCHHPACKRCKAVDKAAALAAARELEGQSDAKTQ